MQALARFGHLTQGDSKASAFYPGGQSYELSLCHSPEKQSAMALVACLFAPPRPLVATVPAAPGTPREGMQSVPMQQALRNGFALAQMPFAGWQAIGHSMDGVR